MFTVHAPWIYAAIIFPSLFINLFLVFDLVGWSFILSLLITEVKFSWNNLSYYSGVRFGCQWTTENNSNFTSGSLPPYCLLHSFIFNHSESHQPFFIVRFLGHVKYSSSQSVLIIVTVSNMSVSKLHHFQDTNENVEQPNTPPLVTSLHCSD